MKRRIAQLPLHWGKAPPWLFKRMVRLAGAVTMAVVDEYGPEEVLRRLADPWWFQAFGCVLGFDWHSSGVTTVTCGALKEAAKTFGGHLGILVAGGKGATSRRTPQEIARSADRYGITTGDRLIFTSRITAKVDSAAVQDGYQVYHHSFFFTPSGAWCVVQQGMNEAERAARRYHWLGETVTDFVCEPHSAISDLCHGGSRPAVREPEGTGFAEGGSEVRYGRARPAVAPGDLPLLNMVAREAEANRRASAALVRDDPDRLAREIAALTEGATLFAPGHHQVLAEDVSSDRLRKAIRLAHECDPQDFVTLLGTRGVGARTIRSLSLLAELIYGAPAARRDVVPQQEVPAEPGKWADYSFAHGGKDGHPFPVDRGLYDRSIAVLTEAVRRARVGDREKTEALKRLAGHLGQ